MTFAALVTVAFFVPIALAVIGNVAAVRAYA